MNREMALKLKHLEAKLAEQGEHVNALKLINTKLSQAFTDAYNPTTSGPGAGGMTKSAADILLKRMDEAKAQGEAVLTALETQHDDANTLRQAEISSAIALSLSLDGSAPAVSPVRASRKEMSPEEFTQLKTNEGIPFFITSGKHKGRLNTLRMESIFGKGYDSLDFSQVMDINAPEVYEIIIKDAELSSASEPLKGLITSILKHHPKLKKSASVDVVKGSSVERTNVDVDGPDIENLGGGGLKEYGDITKKISTIDAEINSEFRDYQLSLRHFVLTKPEKKIFWNAPKILKMTDNIKKLQEQQKMYMSTRGAQATKINTTAEMITEAVKEIQNNATYRIPEGFPSQGITVTTLRELRNYILNNIKNDAVFLALMTTNLGLNLNTVLPEYNQVVVEEQPQSQLVNGILVLIDENNKYPMPNFAGDPKNRKKFNDLYTKDSCFGFGPVKHNATCTALLLDCIHGDTDNCRNLLASDQFKDMISEDMEKTNVFMIAKLLDNIGYPRSENGIKFDPDMNNWYSKIQTFFSLDITNTAQKSILENIKSNKRLKLALEHMIRKYNKYANVLNRTNSKIKTSALSAVYGKGGDASAALLAYDGYNTTGGAFDVQILDGKPRNINVIYEFAKDLKDKYDITKQYTKLFSTVDSNIRNKNLVIDNTLELEYKNALDSFKNTEVKLNKLLQLFTNFVFLLHKDEKDDAVSNTILDSVLNEDSMKKYIAARNKIMISLNNKRTKMTIMMGPWGPGMLSQ